MIKKQKTKDPQHPQARSKAAGRQICFSAAVILMFAFVSCGYETPRCKMLSAQRDSIRIVQLALQQDVDEYVQLINHLQQGIDKVTAGEALRIQQVKAAPGSRSSTAANEHIAKLNALIRTNREEVAALKKQLGRSAFKARELERRIEDLDSKLRVETRRTAELQSSIEAGDSLLTALKKEIQQASLKLVEAEEETARQVALTAQYEAASAAAYYIAARRAELKNKNILSKAGLCRTVLFQQGVDKSMFTKINIHQTTVIPLPPAVKGIILSSHPAVSYTLDRQGDGQVLQISDPEKFWSITRYLVIQ